MVLNIKKSYQNKQNVYWYIKKYGKKSTTSTIHIASQKVIQNTHKWTNRSVYININMYSEVQLTFGLLYLEPYFLILSDIFIALLCFKIVQLLNISVKYIDCQIYITNLKKTTKIDSNHRLDDKNILIIKYASLIKSTPILSTW